MNGVRMIYNQIVPVQWLLASESRSYHCTLFLHEHEFECSWLYRYSGSQNSIKFQGLNAMQTLRLKKTFRPSFEQKILF